MKDTIYRFLFEEKSVRGQIVRLNKSFTDVLNTHNYPSNVQNLLGEMMVATTLLSSTIKLEGQITLQIQGTNGPLELAVVSCDNHQNIRALAKVQENCSSELTFNELIDSKGVLVISIIPKKGERYQGVIALDKESLSACLEDYFMQSEQLQTQILLFAGNHNNEKMAAGMLLQVLPDNNFNIEDFNHLTTLAATTKQEEIFSLSSEEMLFRLFHEEKVTLFEGQSIQFHCGCSLERSVGALALLSKEDLSGAFKEKNGIIDMKCECCNTIYYIDEALMNKENKEY